MKCHIACDELLPCLFLFLAMENKPRAIDRRYSFFCEVGKDLSDTPPRYDGAVVDYVICFALKFLFIEREDITNTMVSIVGDKFTRCVLSVI